MYVLKRAVDSSVTGQWAIHLDNTARSLKGQVVHLSTPAYLPPKPNTCTPRVPSVPDCFAHTTEGLVLQHNCEVSPESELADAVISQSDCQQVRAWHGRYHWGCPLKKKSSLLLGLCPVVPTLLLQSVEPDGTIRF